MRDYGFCFVLLLVCSVMPGCRPDEEQSPRPATSGPKHDVTPSPEAVALHTESIEARIKRFNEAIEFKKMFRPTSWEIGFKEVVMRAYNADPIEISVLRLHEGESLEEMLSRLNQEECDQRYANSLAGRVERLKKAWAEWKRVQDVMWEVKTRAQALATMGEPSSRSKSAGPLSSEVWRYDIDPCIRVEIVFRPDGKVVVHRHGQIGELMDILGVGLDGNWLSPYVRN